MENGRGIFSIHVLMKIVNGLIYDDKYQDIDSNMSDSNIGERRNRNSRNHLFIIYGIINSVMCGEDDPVDIQIYDLEKAFDALWIEDCLNHIMDTLPSSSHDDKVALLYEANKHNQVAINTAVGLTERVDIPCIVMQGGKWGPIHCSNSLDKVGKRCYDRGQPLYSYKRLVNV